uniref:Uncharacterized protein n=1 Tax=Vibrio pommerensis TaxID=161725 RepID=Q93IK3_9VIBR|nr:hypothetical protein [Vibrio pommerensis]
MPVTPANRPPASKFATTVICGSLCVKPNVSVVISVLTLPSASTLSPFSCGSNCQVMLPASAISALLMITPGCSSSSNSTVAWLLRLRFTLSCSSISATLLAFTVPCATLTATSPDTVSLCAVMVVLPTPCEATATDSILPSYPSLGPSTVAMASSPEVQSSKPVMFLL